MNEELSIEEKARRYDEAIKRAKGAHNCAKSDKENGVTDKITEYTIQLTETLFPELKESEDEKIRKYIHSHFQEHLNKTKEFLSEGMIAPFSSEEIKMLEASVAWIEKQGNNNMGISEATKKKLEDNLNKALEKETPESWNEFLEEQNDQKPTLPKWKYKNDNTPLLRDSLILNKYGRVAKSPSGALVSNVWVIDYDELAKLPKEKFPANEKRDFGYFSESANKIEPKFKVGDWVVTTYGKVNQVVAVNEDSDEYTLDDGTYFSGSWKEGYHSWTIEDATDGDVLVCESGKWTCIFKKLVNDKRFSSYCCFMDKTKRFREKECEYHALNKEFMKTHNGEIKPATKEQRDTFFAKMKEAGYEWDAENKKLKKIEPISAEWSKEDEKFFKTALWHISYSVSNGKSTNLRCDTTDWLKSLKERIQQQPKPELNKEDEKTIKEVIQLIEEGALSIDGKTYYIDRLKSIGSRK